MALTVVATGDRADAWTGSYREGATNLIASLRAADFFGREGKRGTIASNRHWRIDREKDIAGVSGAPGKSNIHLQKNDVSRPSTMACVIVPNQYFFQLDGPDKDNREAELTRILRQAFNVSLESWRMTTEAGPRGKRAAIVYVHEVEGGFSSPRPDFVSPQKPVK